MRLLILSGANHGFAACVEPIRSTLSCIAGPSVEVTEDKGALASPTLGEFDALVLGTGFTRTSRKPDGTVMREPELSAEQQEGLLEFVRSGKGLVGIHGTGWWIGGSAYDLIGGHSNWHPPGLKFTVQIQDRDHPVSRELQDFEVEDEIYISAYDPQLRILAAAEWSGRLHPMAWVKPYGEGRVFYTTLGHGPGTFAQPGMQALLRAGAAWAAGG